MYPETYSSLNVSSLKALPIYFKIVLNHTSYKITAVLIVFETIALNMGLVVEWGRRVFSVRVLHGVQRTINFRGAHTKGG